LSLRCSFAAANTAVDVIRDMSLTSLDISFCGNVTSDALLRLFASESLCTRTLVELDVSGVTDNVFEAISRLPELTTLGLFICFAISAAGLAHLRAMKNLTSFDFRNTRQIDDSALEHLRELPLRVLRLCSCKNVSDAGLRACIGANSKLVELDVGAPIISDAGLAHIAENARLLEHLVLDGSKAISDAGIAHLRRLPRLAVLSLQGCEQLGDATLQHLASLRSLRIVTLPSHFSDFDLTDLLKALPLAKIVVASKF
jgi:hypothetical protein